jgi:hypothetical protein
MTDVSSVLLDLQAFGDRVSDVYKEFNRLRAGLEASQRSLEESTASVKASSDLLERAHAEVANAKLAYQELASLKSDLLGAVSAGMHAMSRACTVVSHLSVGLVCLCGAICLLRARADAKAFPRRGSI